MNPAVLSKSKYLDGLKCPKLLWYEYNRKSEIAEKDPSLRLRFEEGKRVGECAQRLFPDGLHLKREAIPEKHSQQSLTALSYRRPLFEAGFVYQQAYALADILVPVENDAWDLIEVKSATNLRKDYYFDLAFQKYTYTGAGLKIRDCYLMYINNQYRRSGEIDPEKLFMKVKVSERIDELVPKIEEEIKGMLNVIAEKEVPDIKIGSQCNAPYGCPLHDICWSFMPDEEHIFILHKGRESHLFDLMERGILKVSDIPEEELEGKQLIQVESHRQGVAHIDKEAIRDFLTKLKYPLHFLDFEALTTALPPYDNTRPFEEIPFQYSLYVKESEDQPAVHYSYLAPGDLDPRSEILKQLNIYLGKSGSIIAYYAPFEIKVIKKASEAYPVYENWFNQIVDRFVDLYEPFQKFFLYYPAQAGSTSLKSVLPAVTGSTYQGMEIADGMAAASEYYHVTFVNPDDQKERERVRGALEKYCDLDTRGMMEILEVLIKEGR